MKPRVVLAGIEPDSHWLSYLTRVAEIAEVTRISPDDRQGLLAALPGTVVLATRRGQVDTAAMDAAGPSLKAICVFGIGFEQVDVEAATARGIMVTNAPVFAPSMAEAALTLMLALTHKLLPKVERARRGWRVDDSLRGRTLHGRTFGTIGFGRIGRETARRASAFGMRVLAHDPWLTPDQIAAAGGQPTSFDQVLRESDYVALNCPLSPETQGIIGKRELALMKPTAVFINVARGPLVDERALVEALRAGKIAGAGLDVLAQEPPAPDHPLLSMENVVVTPHCLGATIDSQIQVAQSVAQSVIEVLSGVRPAHVVNREVLTR